MYTQAGPQFRDELQRHNLPMSMVYAVYFPRFLFPSRTTIIDECVKLFRMSDDAGYFLGFILSIKCTIAGEGY